jgi:hypothetical protein
VIDVMHRRVLRSAALLGAVALVACRSNASGFPADDASSAEQGDEDGSSSSSPTGSSSSGSGSGSGVVSHSSSSGGASSSGSHGGSSSGSGSGGACVTPASTPRVASNITFNDAGIMLCGTVECDLTANTCCVSATADGTCLSHGMSCPPTSVAGVSLPQAQFECLQASDCPCGQVCCGVANDSSSSASAGSNCQDISATGACSPVADAGAQSKSGSAQLCQTDAECKNGMTCTWQDCSVQTPYGAASPNLTMCGIQSDAPFNCSACPGAAKCAQQAN